MSSLSIKTIDGKSAGEYTFPEDLLVFDKGDQALHEAIVAYRANQRQGSASTITKGEVNGSNKKLWKQKGTGRARTGRRQSPIWRGGGTVFGPHPRSYRKKMTKKALHLAVRRAVSELVSDDRLIVIDELKIASGKTKEFNNVLKSLGIERGALFLVKEFDADAVLASRNIARIEMAEVRHANVYQLLRYPQVVITKEALADLESRLQPQVRN